MPLPLPEFDQLDGLAQAELVRSRQVSSAELLDAALARIAARNPALNAVVRLLEREARAQLASIDPAAPFAGVPMLIKDLLATIAGVPTSNGSRLAADRPAEHDSELIRRYRRAGAVFVGKSNTPELGLTPFTESAALGPARNPWDLSRTTGGSSGGSGAAVAARLVAIGHGGDGGGSIRIPASACGIFGLKPTRGRNPTGPDIGDVWRGFVQEHVLTVSVRDSAAMLDATEGEDIGTSTPAPATARPFLEEVGREPGRLRIAVTDTPFFGGTVHPDCRASLDDAAQLLRSLGHDVEDATPPIDGHTLARAFLTVVAAETRSELEYLAEQLRRAPRASDVEPATWALGLLGQHFRASEYATAVRVMQTATRQIGTFFTSYDVLVTPTLGAPPFPIGALQPTAVELAAVTALGRLNLGGVLNAAGLLEQTIEKVFGFIPYTPLFNITGQPAMSVPLYWNAAGLPVGTQFVSRFGDDATLFRLAAQLEQARAWAHRLPPLLAQ